MLSSFSKHIVRRVSQTPNFMSNFSTSAASLAPPRIVIVGGVAGGATAAARAKRLNENAQITVLERGPDVSFANCGLPYYIGEEITDRSKLLLHTPSSLGKLLGIQVQTGQEVVKINRADKTISFRPTSSSSSVSSLPYDKLLLSTGAAPLRPPIPGIDSPLIMTLRNMQDMDAIMNRVDQLAKDSQNKRVIVVGAGFIGLEMVEALAHRGLSVTLVEAKPQVLPVVDIEMTQMILRELKSHNVQVILNDRITAFNSGSSSSSSSASVGSVGATLASGQSLSAELVIMSAGVAPETKLAQEAGLEVDPRSKAVLVNQWLQTSDPDIYAVGDAVMTPNTFFSNFSASSSSTSSTVLPSIPLPARNWIPLAGPANRQARIAADHMLLADPKQMDPYRGSLGTSIVRVFDTVVATTGLTETYLKFQMQLQNQTVPTDDKELPFESVIVHGYDHASYYPGATPITMKVIWDKATRRLLGAQAYGTQGVDKRIDILATALLGHMKVDDLAHLELCYAPPFGSARDIVNTAGFTAQNIQRGLLTPVKSLPVGPEAGSTIIDVRDRDVAALRPIPGALNIPLGELREHLEGLDKNKPYTAVCALGKTSYFASRILAENGFQVQSLLGGLILVPKSSSSPKVSKASTSSPPSPPSSSSSSSSAPLKEVVVDACGLACPGPIMAIRKALPNLAEGQVLAAKASDTGFANDFPAFCESAGMELVSVEKSRGIITGKLRKPLGTGSSSSASSSTRSDESLSCFKSQSTSTASSAASVNNQDVAIVVFSGDMDKVLAAMVIANGAVAMGGKATLFFTFWGLNALRKDGISLGLSSKDSKGSSSSSSSSSSEKHTEEDDHHHQHQKKSLMEAAMGMMMPKGVDHLPLSQMNMGGFGSWMMKRTMKEKHLPNLPGLMADAAASGQVRFVACTMSMDALSIGQEELLEGCELGGVAEFLASAQKAKTTLFI